MPSPLPNHPCERRVAPSRVGGDSPAPRRPGLSSPRGRTPVGSSGLSATGAKPRNPLGFVGGFVGKEPGRPPLPASPLRGPVSLQAPSWGVSVPRPPRLHPVRAPSLSSKPVKSFRSRQIAPVGRAGGSRGCQGSPSPPGPPTAPRTLFRRTAEWDATDAWDGHRPTRAGTRGCLVAKPGRCPTAPRTGPDLGRGGPHPCRRYRADPGRGVPHPRDQG